MTSDEFDLEDVHEVLGDIHESDVISLGMPTGEDFVIVFTAGEYGEEEMYRFEVNLHSGSLWFQRKDDGDWNLLYSRKRGY